MHEKLRQHYVLFRDDVKGTRIHQQYPELRARGWVSVFVPSLVRKGETIGQALVRMEDEAAEVATKFFGTTWYYVSSSLSEEDFPEDEIMRIEYQYAPGIEDGYAIMKRQRHVQYQSHDCWEDVTGLALLDMMNNTVFAQASGIRPEQVADDLRVMADRLKVYSTAGLPEVPGTDDLAEEFRAFAALVREGARIIEELDERLDRHDY